jgi:ankyrin repeat protein
MGDIWEAAKVGDVGEVERLLGQDPGLLDAGGQHGMTPLMFASRGGHVRVVRWLVDKGAAINEHYRDGRTALWFACFQGRAPVVRWLVEKGADASISTGWGSTPLMAASYQGHLEVVRLLLGFPSAKATMNHRDGDGGPATTAARGW